MVSVDCYRGDSRLPSQEVLWQCDWLKGIIVPSVTPAKIDKSQIVVDVESQRKMVRYLKGGEADVVFLASNAGEGRKMSENNWKTAVLSGTDEALNVGLPAVAGVLRPNLTETLRCVQFAQEVGVHGIVVAPMLSKDSNPDEVLTEVLEAAKVPVILYNNPKDFGAGLEFEFIQKAAKLEGIKGIKDTSNDEDFFAKLLELKLPEFKVMQGNARGQLPGLQQADGMVPMPANLFLQEFKGLFDNRNELVSNVAEFRQTAIKACDDIHNQGGLQFIKTKLVEMKVLKEGADKLFS